MIRSSSKSRTRTRQSAPASEFAAHPRLTGFLKFAPDTGHIHLFDQRMLLMHAASFAELRRELIAQLGQAKARELMTRLGYQQGYDDGRRVSALGLPLAEQLKLGPGLREIEGFVRNQPIDAMRFDIARGEFYGDYYWASSWEANAHIQQCGLSGVPACWMMAGYADGYSTAITGLPIHWRESQCVAMGHPQCRVVGRPLREWTDADAQDTHYLQIESFVGAPTKDYAGALPTAGQANVFAGFVGASAGFNAVANLVRKVAPTDSTVLFRGESGVGKECFTRALHSISPRAAGPLVTINCAAIPQELVEAELFGVERGAYTGAVHTRPGRFERADGGTLFLDEITSLPLSAQGKLLRALQSREIERVGGTEVRRVDVRIVAAANRDLREEVAAGRFRTDLFYRLNVFPIEIPPLRERREDIPLLVDLFVRQCMGRFAKSIAGLSPSAYAALWEYDWPGNVRELENMIERGVILADSGGTIDVQHLFAGGEKLSGNSFNLSAGGTLVRAVHPDRDAALAQRNLADALLDANISFEALEALLFERALVRNSGNVSATARALKMGRGQVEYRLKKYGNHASKPS